MLTGDDILELVLCTDGLAEWCGCCPAKRRIPSPKVDGVAVEPDDYICPCDFDVTDGGCIKHDFYRAALDAACALADELERGAE